MKIDRYICTLYVSNKKAQPLYLMGTLHNYFASACTDNNVFVGWQPAMDISETRYRVVIEQYYKGHESIISLFLAVANKIDYRFMILFHQQGKGMTSLYQDIRQEELPLEQ